MTVFRPVVLLCDFPGGCEDTWRSPGEQSPSVARTLARRAGWRQSAGQDLCPRHTAWRPTGFTTTERGRSS